MRSTRWRRERSSRLKVKRVRVLITSVIGWLQVTDGKKIIWEDPFSAHSFWKGPNTPLGFSIANIHVPDSPNCSFSTTGEFAAFHSDCILHSASFLLAVFVVSLHAPVSVFWTHRYTEYSQGLPVLCWHTQFRFWYWLSIQNFNIWFHDTSLTTAPPESEILTEYNLVLLDETLRSMRSLRIWKGEMATLKPRLMQRQCFSLLWSRPLQVSPLFAMLQLGLLSRRGGVGGTWHSRNLHW